MNKHERFGFLFVGFLTFTIEASSILLAMKHSQAVLFSLLNIFISFLRPTDIYRTYQSSARVRPNTDVKLFSLALFTARH